VVSVPQRYLQILPPSGGNPCSGAEPARGEIPAMDFGSMSLLTAGNPNYRAMLSGSEREKS